MSEGDSTNEAGPGTIIGSYRLIHGLGSGGMSSVFKAIHIETGHEVALKLLPRALAKNQTMLSRFLREAKTAESLEHPNIVSIFDRGVDAGRHYLVLEYVEGGDLQERVKTRGPLPIAEAVRVIKTVAEGLRFAASQGLIHRDIKPANLLVAPNGQVKIIDLGLALQPDNEDERVTRDGTTVGTVDYMSPEQARDSRATSERSDIYSLGCTFYYLLTGSAPFPGGNVSDKLSRHFTKPRPDPRTLRPEIPGALAKLVQKMMAKRPEKRFQGYDELIAALEVVPTDPGEIELVPLESTEDEDSDSGSFELEPAAGEASSGSGDSQASRPPDPSVVKTTTLELDLAPLDEQERPSRSALRSASEKPTRPASTPASDPEQAQERPSRSALRSRSGAEDRPPSGARTDPAVRKQKSRKSAIRTTPVPGTEPDLLSDALLEESREEPVEAAVSKRIAFHPSRKKYASQNWIITYVVAGVAMGLLLLGIAQATRKKGVPTLTEKESQAPPGSTPSGAPGVETLPISPDLENTTEGEPQPETSKGPSSRMGSRAPSWSEPSDPVPAPVPEVSYSSDLEARFVPRWARSPIPDHLSGDQISIRRIPDPNDSAQYPSLRTALDKIGDTVEIEVAGNGPFFEDDLRSLGKTRMIRARPGYHPAICIEPPQKDAVKEQPAVFVVSNRNLILDGLDLIVDVKDLTRRQTALFLCQGATLTLRNCTITIINPQGVPFAAFQTDHTIVRGPDNTPKTTYIRLESTLVRGPQVRMFELGRAPVEVAVLRSVLAGTRGPLITGVRPDPSFSRRFSFVRSILACNGPMFETEGPAPGSQPNPLAIQALGSSFGRFESAGLKSSLISLREDADIPNLVNWSGDHNVYSGWSDWASTVSGHSVRVADLNEVRATWPKTDTHSQQRQNVWPMPARFEQITAAYFRKLDPEREGSLLRVAAPSPCLLEETVFAFPRLSIPAVLEDLLATPHRIPGVEMVPLAFPNPDAYLRNLLELTFDPESKPWNGDLGLFLRDQLPQVKADERRIRVKVQVGGSFTITPIRFPPGLSLEVVYDPPPPPFDPEGRSLKPPPPLIWTASKALRDEALIDIRGGDLLLSNVRLANRDPRSGLKSLVRVNDGHLVLDRCWLMAPGEVVPSGGGLIVFNAASTRPMSDDSGLFDRPADRPICRLIDCMLITGGDVLTTEVGRATLSLSNCAIAAGGTIFSLIPAKVARSRFEAGLGLDHCTLAAQKTFVLLSRWPGTEPGPDRPWLIETHGCAFMATYDRPVEGVLLRVEPEAIARGTVFWEADRDAFEVVNFTARSDRPVVPNSFPDIGRHWIDLWGNKHMRNVTGTSLGRAGTGLRFNDRLRANDVKPEDLALRNRGQIGADLNRLELKPLFPISWP